MRRLGLIVILLLLCLPALALQFRNGDTVVVNAGETINDDLIVSGSTADLRGSITNDLVVAGGTVNVNGPVGGDLIAAGGTVNVNSPVRGTLYVAGGTVNLNANVGRNAVVAGGTLNVAQGMSVTRDLAVSGGTVTMAGTVTGNMLLSAGTLTLTDTARVGGDLTGQAGTSSIAEGAVIGGTTAITQGERRRDREGRGGGILGWLGFNLWLALAALLVGLAAIALAPRFTAETVGMLRARPWWSLLAGLLAILLIPLVFFLLLITVIGIPLAFILCWLAQIATFLAPIMVAILIGTLILRNPAKLYLGLLIGMGIFFLLWLVPCIGWGVTIIALIFGLGAEVLALQGRSRRPFFHPHEEQAPEQAA